MKGRHQQSSVLSALSKHDLIPLELVEKISADFLLQKKTFLNLLKLEILGKIYIIN